MANNATRTSSSRHAPHVLALLASLFALTTCKAPFGLGGQVDTEAPAITIETPTRNAYISGTISITGTATDDLGVASVSITLSRKDGTVLGTYAATLSDGIYTASIPDSSAFDGSVVVEVTATDDQQKSTIEKTSIYIDNRPPTLIVTSPLTYGAGFTPVVKDYIEISGQAYDAGSNLVEISVSILAENGAVLATKPADPTSSWFIRFEMSEIPGLTALGRYLYLVTAKDEAGNAGSWYYHRTDIYRVKDTDAAFPPIDGIGKLEQGLSTEAFSGVTLQELLDNRLSATTELGDFIYDPNAKPTITFTNLDKTLPQNENLLNVNSVITGYIIPQEGGGAITDISGTIYKSDSPTVPLVDYIDTDQASKNDNIEISYATATFTIYLKDEELVPLVPGAYELVVKGESDGAIGESRIPFFIDSGVPELTVNLASSPSYHKTKIKLNGTATHALGVDFIEIYESSNAGSEVLIQTIDLTGTTTETWESMELPSGATPSDGAYNFTCILQSVSGKRSTPLSRSITYDVTAPTIELAVNPVVVASNALNGTVTQNVSVIDGFGISAVKQWILPAASPAPIWTDACYREWATPTDSFELDTTLPAIPSGNVTIWLRARDNAQNETLLSRNYLIDQDSDKPVFTLTNLNAAFATTDEAPGNLLQTGAKIDGTISDDDGVVATTLTIAVDDAAPVAVTSYTAQGTTGFSFNHDLSALGEGVHHVALYASDIKGKAADVLTVYFVVDTKDPVVTITAPATGSFKNSGFTISGTATDSNELHATEPISATVSKDGNAATAATVSGTLPDWNIDVAGLTNGSYTYTITAKDQFGKTSATTLTVIFDSSAPAVVIETPLAASWNRGSSMGATGTASDTNGIASVQWSTDSTNGTNGTWNTVSSGTTSWSSTIDISSLGEGSGKTLWVRATDLAGNTGTASRLFGIDQTDPSSSATAPSSAATAFSISGTAIDTNGVKSLVVTQIKDGEVDHPVTVLNLTGLSTTSQAWTAALLPSGGVNTGSYDYTITITDLADHSVQYTRTVTIDLDKPASTITDPLSSAQLFGNSYEIRGTASDTGPSGLQKVEYSFNGTSWTDATGTGAWSATINLLTLAEGSKTLTVRSVDNAGNVQDPVSTVSFYVDQSAPSISSLEPVTQNTRTLIVIDGSASDTNALLATSPISATWARANSSDTGSFTVTGTTSWSFNVDPDTDGAGVDTGLSEGTYTITITATDAALRTTSIVRTVVIDVSAPTITTSTPAASSAVSNSTLTATGTASDGTGSGVDLVQYSLNYTNDANDANDTWVNASGTTAWNASIALGAEGPKILSVRSRDVLTQYSAIQSVSFSLDLTPPTLTESTVGSGTQKRSDGFTLSGTASDTNGLKTWDDTIDGLNSVMVPYVEVSVNNGEAVKVTVSDGTWSYSYTVASDGSDDGEVVFTITATDIVDKPTQLTRTVIIDTTPPAIQEASVISGIVTESGEVNGDIGIRFTASDTLAGIERSGALYQAYYTVVANDAVIAQTATAVAGWTAITSTASTFNFSYPTTSVVSGLRDLYIGVRDAVTDPASDPGTGIPNVTVYKIDLNIDQESDRPRISVDNLDETAATNFVNGLGQNPSILVTIEDDDLVDVSNLRYRIDANNDGDYADTAVELGTTDDEWENETTWYPFDEVPSADKSLAQGKILLTGFPQGLFRIQMEAIDTVAGTYSTGQTASIRFSVDYGPPSISISAPVSGTYNSDITLTGSAVDALGVINVKYRMVSQASPDPAYTNIFEGNETNVPIGSSIDISTLDTGEYTLQIVATDVGNTSATQQIPITIDKSLPTVTFLQPAASATLNGTIVTVSGEAQDNRLVGKVFLWHGLVAAADPALPARTGPGTYSSGGYTPLDGKGVWSTTIDTTAQVATATDAYRIRVVAIDDIGNVGVPVDRLVTIDQASDKPSIAFSNLDLVTPSRLGTGARIIATTTDDDSVDWEYLQIRIDYDGDGNFTDDHEGWANISNRPTSDAAIVSWYHTVFPDGVTETQGKKYAQVRALDINASAANRTVFTTFAESAGLTGYTWVQTDPVEFYIDYGPPALTLTSPTSGTRFNVSQYQVTGTTNDGNGVDYVSIWTDDDGDQSKDAGETIWIYRTGASTIGTTTDAATFAARTATLHLTTDDAIYSISQLVSGLGVAPVVKPVQISSFDTAGAASVRDLTVVIDTQRPTASFNAPADGATVNGTLTVSGLANDNYQLASVYYAVVPFVGALPGVAPVFPGAGWTAASGSYAWTIPLATTAYTDGSYTIYVTATDTAANSTESPASRNIVISQESDRPVISTLTITEGSTAVANLLPTSLQISGTIQDDDGIEPTSVQIRSKLISSGSWGAWANVSDQPETNATIVTWSHAFTGLTDGLYEYQVRALDINASSANDTVFADFAASTGLTGFSWAEDPSVQFAVDLSMPQSTIASPVQGSFHNATVTINGSASDASGIKSVSLAYKVEPSASYGAEEVLYADANAADGYATPYAWTKSYAVASGDNFIVFFRLSVTDAFDKIRTYEQYFTVDTSGPTITFQQPSADSTVNGSLLIRGSTSDTNQVSQVWLKVNNAAGAGADWATATLNPLATNPTTDWILASGSYSWSYRMHSTLLSNAAATAYAMAIDSAGNRSNPTLAANQLAFTVNQSQNLPVITFTTANDAVLDNTGYITGTITDDDGVNASTIQISFNSTDGIDGDWTNVSNQGTSGLSVNWSHALSLSTPPERAAAYNVRVRAYDAGEYDGATEYFPPVRGVSAARSIYKDDGAPTLTLDSITVDNPYGGAANVISGSFNGSYVNDDLTLAFTATDTSGIASVEISLDNGVNWITDATGPYTLPITVNRVTHAYDGTRTILYRATDLRSKITSGSITLIVDTVEPVISFSTPAGMQLADPPNVNGAVTVFGSVSDSSSVSSLTLRGGSSSQVSFTNTGNTIAWKIENIPSSTYANATYSAAQALNVWRFMITAAATDAAGNISGNGLGTPGYLDIDPDGDRPIITVVSPEDEDSVAGVFLVNGTVADDDGAQSVRLQIDLNDDGIYGPVDGGFDGDLDLNNDDDVLDDFETETRYRTISVTNGAWSLLLNSSGELNKSNLIARGLAAASGTIQLRVVPVDINGTTGIEQTLSVYIDAEAPVIRGVASDGTTEVVYPTPATSSLQRESITVRALFRDDKELDASSMQVSFNGGSSYQNISTVSSATISTNIDTVGGGTFGYRIAIPVDTRTIIAGGNGNLSIVLKVSDRTYKQTSYTLEYTVDNTRPEVMWNIPGTISYVGTIPSETYSFKGDTDDADRVNQLFGKAIDSGTISGISHIDVYFVKNGFFESPRSAVAPLAVTNADLYRSGLDRNADGDYVDANEYPPAASISSVPFTANADYFIRIDKRTELGAYDAISGIGDQDGFNESLKAKTGYDEWYSFFDTTAFPDGPLTVYFVAYDEAGNASYDYAAGQMANHPPTIGSVSVGGQTINDLNTRAKVIGTVGFTINATDAEGVTVADFRLSVTNRYALGAGGSLGTEDETFTSFYYDTSAVSSGTGWKAAFNTLTPPTGNATTATALATINTAGGDYPSGNWYRFEAQAKDTDGNTITRAFYVWVNNSDSSAPVVTMNDFTQTSLSGVSGHIEEAGNSPHADGQADLSGTVNVTGTVYDDTAIASVTLEVSYNGGSTWVSLPNPVTSFGTAISGNAIDGYTYNWTYPWNTATITNGAALDVMIRAFASDGTNVTTDDLDTDYFDFRAGRTVDVVPYITDLTTGFDSGLRAYVKRSALGKYTVARGGADITIVGYNFSTASTVTVGGVAATIVGTPTSSAIVIDNLAELASGEVIVTTNSAASRNNSNDNAQTNNKEPNAYNPNLVDDRYIAFWDVASRASTGTVADPVMKPNSTRNGFDWMYTKNGKELWINQAGSELKVTQSNGLKGGDFTYTSSGSPVFIFNHNIQWTAYANTFSYTGGLQWGAIPTAWDWSTDAGVQPYAFTTDRDEAYNWHMRDGLPKLGLGNISFLTGTAPTTTWYPAYNDLDTSRYQSPLVRTVGTDTGFRNYVAYFDANSAESRGIAFYAFWAGSDTATVTSGTSFYLYKNDTGDPQIVLNDQAPGPAANAEWYATIDKFHLKDPDQEIALAGTQGSMDGGIMTPRGRMEVTGVNSAANSSQFDLGVYAVNATTHYGYLAYFDEQASRLMIASKTDLYTSNPAAPGNAWLATQVDTNAGAYVKMAVDPVGGIHLAYQDTATGYLKYAYLTFNGTAFTIARIVTVDALIGSGMYNSITVRDFGTADYRPVITTFSSAFVGSNAAFRVAYPVTNQASITNGANVTTGAFTGTWESIAIPALSGVQAGQGFTETDGATFSAGRLFVGYKGSLLEEARFQEDPTRYAKRPDQP